MKRRFIFTLTVAALLLNLALGAKIFLSAARLTNDDDNARAKL